MRITIECDDKEEAILAIRAKDLFHAFDDIREAFRQCLKYEDFEEAVYERIEKLRDECLDPINDLL